MIERNSEWFTVGNWRLYCAYMEVLDGCWQNEDRNPNIGFYRVSINPVMDSYPSQGYLS